MNIYDIILQSDAVKLGEYEIYPGTTTPIYFDISEIISNPRLFDMITDMLADKLREINPDKIAGAFTSGIPLATALSLKTNIPMVFIRRETKTHGLKTAVEGVLKPGERVVLIDDMITETKHNIPFINIIKATGAKITDFLVVVDYGLGAKEGLEKQGVFVESLTKISEVVSKLAGRGIITKQRAKEINSKMHK